MQSDNGRVELEATVAVSNATWPDDMQHNQPHGHTLSRSNSVVSVDVRPDPCEIQEISWAETPALHWMAGSPAPDDMVADGPPARSIRRSIEEWQAVSTISGSGGVKVLMACSDMVQRKDYTKIFAGMMSSVRRGQR